MFCRRAQTTLAEQSNSAPRLRRPRRREDPPQKHVDVLHDEVAYRCSLHPPFEGIDGRGTEKGQSPALLTPRGWSDDHPRADGCCRVNVDPCASALFGAARPVVARPYREGPHRLYLSPGHLASGVNCPSSHPVRYQHRPPPIHMASLSKHAGISRGLGAPLVPTFLTSVFPPGLSLRKLCTRRFRALGTGWARGRPSRRREAPIIHKFTKGVTYERASQ